MIRPLVKLVLPHTRIDLSPKSLAFSENLADKQHFIRCPLIQQKLLLSPAFLSSLRLCQQALSHVARWSVMQVLCTPCSALANEHLLSPSLFLAILCSTTPGKARPCCSRYVACRQSLCFSYTQLQSLSSLSLYLSHCYCTVALDHLSSDLVLRFNPISYTLALPSICNILLHISLI